MICCAKNCAKDCSSNLYLYLYYVCCWWLYKRVSHTRNSKCENSKVNEKKLKMENLCNEQNTVHCHVYKESIENKFATIIQKYKEYSYTLNNNTRTGSMGVKWSHVHGKWKMLNGIRILYTVHNFVWSFKTIQFSDDAIYCVWYWISSSQQETLVEWLLSWQKRYSGKIVYNVTNDISSFECFNAYRNRYEI